MENVKPGNLNVDYASFIPAMTVVGNLRTRPYYSRRCKRLRPTTIDSLSNELLLEILARVPADDLQERAMFVCRSWYHIIRSRIFVNAQIHHSPYGLLLYHKYPVLVTAAQGRIQAREFPYMCKSACFTSVNTGLVLDACPRTTSLNIKNLATRQRMELPSFGRSFAGRCGIGYAASSMDYKVVQPFRDEKLSLGVGVSILTVGVDKSWRNVEMQHMPPPLHQNFWFPSLSGEGFIHWFRNEPNNVSVVTLDIENEIFTWSEVPLPRAYLSHETTKTFLWTGRLLTLLVGYKDLSWEVWGKELRNGEWSKVLPDIKLGGVKSRLEELAGKVGGVKLRLHGWVKYPEVLAFYLSCCSRTCIFYNLDTHEIDSIQLREPAGWYTGYVLKNSLIWLNQKD